MSDNKKTSNGKAVFVDTKGHRGRYFNSVSIIAGTVTTILLALFALSVLVNPFLPQVRLKPSEALPQKNDLQVHLPERPITKQESIVKRIGQNAREEKEKREDEKLAKAADLDQLRALTREQDIRSKHDGPPLAIGFFVNWDDSSLASIEHNLDSLDWIVPEWIRLSGDPNDPLTLDLQESVAQKALKLIKEKRPEMPILPL